MTSFFDQYSDTRLLSKVLYLHFIEEVSQTEIAKSLGLSVPKVNRLIKKGRAEGMVKVQLHLPFQHLLEIENKIKHLYKLEEAIIVPKLSSSDESILQSIGQSAAKYFLDHLRDGDIIAVSGGRALHTMIEYLTPKRKYKIKVVPAVGGVQGSLFADVNYLAAQLANRLGGTAYQLLAPAFVDTPEERESLFSLRHVSEIVEMAKNAQIAIFGIGSLTPETSSYFQFTSLPSQEVHRIARETCGVGQILAHMYNKDGRICSEELSSRVIGIRLEELKSIPIRIAIAGLEHKTQSIAGALQGGYPTTLVSYESTAENIIKIHEAQSNPAQ